MDDLLDDSLQEHLEEFLRSGVTAHKRRVAIRAGVRESYELEEGCNHAWDPIRRWCSRCGLTLLEKVERRAGG